MPRFVSLVGKRFGLLTVSHLAESKQPGARLWMCRCDCGKTCLSSTAVLHRGSKKSCGCQQIKRSNNSPHWKGVGQVTGSIWYRFNREAVRRGVEVTLNIGDLWDLFQKQRGRCAITGIPITLPTCRAEERSYSFTASVDRADPTKPYTANNVQWVHKVINQMKSDLPQAELVNRAVLIVKHHKRKLRSA